MAKLIPFGILKQSRSVYIPTNGRREHPGMDYVRENIELLMNGRSVKVVGEESGVSQSWLQRFMNPDKPSGIQKPNADKLSQLADYFGVSLSELMHERLSAGAQSQSQAGRHDFRKMGHAVTVLREYLAVTGDPDDWVTDPIMLEVAYEVVEDFGQPVTPTNVIDLTKRLGRRIREGANNERNKVLRAGATPGQSS